MIPRRFKALVLDYGGVLTTPMQEAFVRFSERSGIELQDLLRVLLRAYTGGEDELVVAYETGRLSDAEFSSALARRLSELTGRDVVADGLLTRLFDGIALEESMFETVSAARAGGYKTGLLSNSWGLQLYPRERLDDLFDAVVISGEVALRKPNPRIFALIAERLALSPEEIVFVDDHPGHLKAALELGMTTILHRSPEDTISQLGTLLGIALPPDPQGGRSGSAPVETRA